MQAFSAQSAQPGTPVRFRVCGERPWRLGETVEVRGSELMFLCDTPLELRVEVEVSLSARMQAMGGDSAMNLICTGRVLRRFLANWPEVRSALVVSLESCRIVTEGADAA